MICVIPCRTDKNTYVSVSIDLTTPHTHACAHTVVQNNEYILWPTGVEGICGLLALIYKQHQGRTYTQTHMYTFVTRPCWAWPVIQSPRAVARLYERLIFLATHTYTQQIHEMCGPWWYSCTARKSQEGGLHTVLPQVLIVNEFNPGTCRPKSSISIYGGLII